VTIPQALRIGREAERFTKRKLRRPFTVRTCLQDARGRSRLPRYFAFVEIAGNDLGEMLVANGLARVFGAAAEAPGKNRPELEWRRLDQLERQAKKEKIGGWAMTLERSSVGTNGKNRASSGD
jgi:endonuclease YncB( thermonuclease family)